MTYKIIAICGESGSGKDTMMKKVLEARPDIHEIVSCTTRPIRENETDGVNYHFLTPEVFADKVLHGEMLEATCFNNWFYGTGFESLRQGEINIGVFNPDGIEALLLHKSEIDVKVFYVRASAKTRLLRQLNRETNPDIDEIIRRYGTDKWDFADLDFDYIEIKNETPEDLESGVKKILSSLEN